MTENENKPGDAAAGEQNINKAEFEKLKSEHESLKKANEDLRL